MPRKKTKSSRRDAAGSQLAFVRWRPSKPGKDDESKRRLSRYDPSEYAAESAVPTDLDLLSILTEMGSRFTLTEEQRRAVLAAIEAEAIIQIQVLLVMEDKPANSELIERLTAIETASRRLYELFEVKKSADQAFENGVFGFEMNPIVREALASSSSPPVALQTISAAVTAAAALAVMAGRAKLSIKPSRQVPSPDQTHSVNLAIIFREAFNKNPTRSIGSPWLKFLRWGRAWAKLRVMSDDRLRKLPIGHASTSKTV